MHVCVFLCGHLINRTSNVGRDLAIMKTWIDNGYPFILVGNERCGKSVIINEVFKAYIMDQNKQNKNVNVATIDCNAYTKSKHIIKKLYQCCSSFNSNTGKVLRPNGCDKLVLYLKDINLAKPDEYATSQIIELFQQFITYKVKYSIRI